MALVALLESYTLQESHVCSLGIVASRVAWEYSLNAILRAILKAFQNGRIPTGSLNDDLIIRFIQGEYSDRLPESIFTFVTHLTFYHRSSLQLYGHRGDQQISQAATKYTSDVIDPVAHKFTCHSSTQT